MFGNDFAENGDDSSQFRRQGSVRKVLPLVPDADAPLSLPAKMIDRQTKNAKNSYAPFFLEYSLMAEYDMLSKQKIPGIYVVPAANSPLKWFGVVFVHRGFYEEGIFRFILHIPENYPTEVVPRLCFQPPVFHPLVNIETGELDLLREFPKWRRNVNFLWQIMAFTKKIFNKLDISTPFNSQAASLFQSDIEMFKFKVSETIRRSKELLFESSAVEDPHDIRFCALENQQYENVKKKMVSLRSSDFIGSKPTDNSSIGFSWVDPDTLQTFSEKRLAS